MPKFMITVTKRDREGNLSLGVKIKCQFEKYFTDIKRIDNFRPRTKVMAKKRRGLCREWRWRVG